MREMQTCLWDVKLWFSCPLFWDIYLPHGWAPFLLTSTTESLFAGRTASLHRQKCCLQSTCTVGFISRMIIFITETVNPVQLHVGVTWRCLSCLCTLFFFYICKLVWFWEGGMQKENTILSVSEFACLVFKNTEFLLMYGWNLRLSTLFCTNTESRSHRLSTGVEPPRLPAWCTCTGTTEALIGITSPLFLVVTSEVKVHQVGCQLSYDSGSFPNWLYIQQNWIRKLMCGLDTEFHYANFPLWRATLTNTYIEGHVLHCPTSVRKE